MNEPKKNPVTDLRTMLESAAPKLAEVAPKHLKAERLIRLLLSAASRNPLILECTRDSVLNFAMTCSQTGLEPIGAGGMWPIPFKNNKTGNYELTAIPDYRGLVNCAKHAKCVKDAFAEAVYTNDDFDYALGLEPYLKHKPARDDRGALESAYLIIVMPDDTRRFVVMDEKEILSIRDRSNAWRAFKKYGKECPWNTDEGEMWKKTVTRRGMKPFTGASQELDKAIELDDAITGAIAVPKAEIPEPKPKKALAAAATAPATEGEDTPEAKDPPEGKTPTAASKAQEEPSGTPAETIDNSITAVLDKKKGIYRIETKDAGVFQTDDDALAKEAGEMMEADLPVTIHFHIKDDRQWLVKLVQ